MYLVSAICAGEYSLSYLMNASAPRFVSGAGHQLHHGIWTCSKACGFPGFPDWDWHLRWEMRIHGKESQQEYHEGARGCRVA